MNRLFCVCLLLTTIACHQDNSLGKKIIKEDTMRIILWEMMQAEGWTEIRSYKDSTLPKAKENARIYTTILKQHGISREAFLKTYDYYVMHPDEYKILMDTLYHQEERKKNIFQPVSPGVARPPAAPFPAPGTNLHKGQFNPRKVIPGHHIPRPADKPPVP